jgi:hypothetical protein
MFRYLMVVMVAVGLASAPLYAVAQAAESTAMMKADHGQTRLTAHGATDHDHASPGKVHAIGQTCCHPGCIMAVVPVFAGTTQASPLSEVVPIPPDLTPVPAIPFGIDRPPKRA